MNITNKKTLNLLLDAHRKRKKEIIVEKSSKNIELLGFLRANQFISSFEIRSSNIVVFLKYNNYYSSAIQDIVVARKIKIGITKTQHNFVKEFLNNRPVRGKGHKILGKFR